MHIADIVAAVFILALIYVLVRPQSKGADLVSSVGTALTAIVKNATDLGSE